MTPQIKQIIAEMREKVKSASNGKWEVKPSSDGRPYIFQSNEKDKFNPLVKTYRNNIPGSANADFIVYARNNITAILDYVERLEKMVIEDRMDTTPCVICGYNGAGYYQSDTHPCAKIWHEKIKK